METKLEPLKGQGAAEVAGRGAPECRVAAHNWGAVERGRFTIGKGRTLRDRGWSRGGLGAAVRCLGPGAWSEPCAPVPTLPARDTNLHPD